MVAIFFVQRKRKEINHSEPRQLAAGLAETLLPRGAFHCPEWPSGSTNVTLCIRQGVAVLCYWGKNLESQRFVYRATQAPLLVHKHYKNETSLCWALILLQEKHLLPTFNQTRVLTRWTITVEMRNLGTESPSLNIKACRIPH